jgi:hypothetical protein
VAFFRYSREAQARTAKGHRAMNRNCPRCLTTRRPQFPQFIVMPHLQMENAAQSSSLRARVSYCLPNVSEALLFPPSLIPPIPPVLIPPISPSLDSPNFPQSQFPQFPPVSIPPIPPVSIPPISPVSIPPISPSFNSPIFPQFQFPHFPQLPPILTPPHSLLR